MRPLRPAAARRAAVVSAATAAVTAVALAVAPAASAIEEPTFDVALPDAGPARTYIVQTEGLPLSSYTGGVAGIAATKPESGQKLDPTTSNARKYKTHLAKGHADVLAEAGISRSAKTRDLTTSFNGFLAELTPAEAARLQKADGVLRVWEDEVVHVDTVSTPDMLGLTGRDGVWAKQFGSAETAGEGVIVGVIDTGFWPENPSFGPLPEPRPDTLEIDRKWRGVCDVGVEEPVTCNNKVIGARYYVPADVADEEFLSPRDLDSHGSHTASTAAGNHGVEASINGVSVGTVSGMAPAARIAVYKALWENPETGQASGVTSNLVQAIEDAVADGVDVINYSISGSRPSVVTPTELAFLFAADAGVFVSTSAGNEGDQDGPGSVAHNSPWVTTVAAGTHDRNTEKTLTLGDGQTFPGVGVGVALPSAPIVDAAAVAAPGASAAEAELCYSDAWTADGQPSLDPAKVAGKIVLCKRGSNDRVDKSLAVKEAGGVGVVLYNPTPNSLNGDFHSVPTIHVDSAAGAAVKAYIAAAGAAATAAISAVGTEPVRAPLVAGFSSYGPAQAAGGDLLKPDVLAPGVDVIAAVSPAATGGNDWNAMSGTSMAAPHVAGIAALLTAQHPGWSPAAIRSALMTTATDRDNTGQQIGWQLGGDASPFNYGAGEIVPGPSFDPGLVYDSGFDEWIAYTCGIGQLQLVYSADNCAPEAYGSIDPSDLNYPSIAVNDLAGSQTVTRTVTNVSQKASKYTAEIEAPAGFDVKVSPRSFTIPAKGSVTYKVTITRKSAAMGEWAFGSLTWTDQKRGHRGHEVRSPLAVRAVAIAAPAEVTGSGTSGSTQIQVTPGYDGTLTTSVSGLVPAEVVPLTLDSAGPSFDSDAPAQSTQTKAFVIDVPEGTTVSRVATYDADFPAGTDVDIFTYTMTGNTLTGYGPSSGGSTAEESVTLTPGRYAVFVDLFATAEGTPTAITVPTYTWVVGPEAAGNLTVTPATLPVRTAKPATLTATWSGLTAGTRYLGAIDFGDGTSQIGRTVVSVAP